MDWNKLIRLDWIRATRPNREEVTVEEKYCSFLPAKILSRSLYFYIFLYHQMTIESEIKKVIRTWYKCCCHRKRLSANFSRTHDNIYLNSIDFIKLDFYWFFVNFVWNLWSWAHVHKRRFQQIISAVSFSKLV